MADKKTNVRATSTVDSPVFEAEQFAQFVAEVRDYAIFFLDPSGRIRTWNAGAEKIKGYTASEIIGEHISRFYPEEALAKGWPDEELRRAAADGRFEDEGWRIRKDGTPFWANVIITALRSPDGELRGFSKITRDLTDRKLAEENARKVFEEEGARKAIDTRLHLAAIVESSSDAIIGQNLSGEITSWNSGAERLYGYSAAEIIGKPTALLVPDDHPDEVPQLMERIRRGERVEHFETERLRRDGTKVDVSLTISPIRNALGTIVGASKIARDIGSRRLEERRKGEFLALLAHELRNPLAAVRNSLHAIALETETSTVANQACAVMERQLQHLVRLVDDLLDVNRISRGKLELRKEIMELKHVISSALETCEPVVKKHSHVLNVVAPTEQILIEADKTRLAQAICNLVSNAAKYSEPKSEISLTASREGDRAVIRVKDRGVGIPAAMLAGIFELFTQVDQSLEKAQGGLGVGLNIVKNLVELHGGTVEAISDGSDLGSEFIIRLPVALGSLQDVSKPPDSSEKRPSATEKRAAGKIRILVVDDNVDAARSQTMLLGLMGHEVRAAHDGLEAVETASEFHPDLILLDIGMPKLNGYEACRRIRKLPNAEQICIVALTGWGQEEDKVRSEEAGFNLHLVKPLEPSALDDLLESLT